MKNIFISLLFAGIFLFTNPTQLKASHFAGAELTYTCLGGSSYQITLTFYRDCSGIPAPTAIPITFVCSSNTAFNFSSTLAKVAGTGQDISTSCSSSATKCSGGNFYGVQEYVYQGQVTLPPCNSWDMHYTSGARNPITTVSGSGNWYTMAMLNSLSAPSNSSPIFKNKPIIVACNNQPLCFNPGAVDPDGDSLVYSFYPVMTTSPTSSISYFLPWSYSNFLTSVTPPGITLNPETGDICFTPTTNLSTAFGIKVEEYRKINGSVILIGTVYRDLTLRIISCNNHTPTLSGMDTSLSHTFNANDTIYRIETCIGNSPITFDINGFDTDTFNPSVSGHPERFSISWNNGIQGASFTTHYNNTDSAYANFSWQPTTSNYGKLKCFTATIEDQACPYHAQQTFSYCFKFKPLGINLNASDTLLCEGDSTLYKANAATNSLNYHWSINGNTLNVPINQDSLIFNSNLYGPGQHLIKVIADNAPNQCSESDSMMINVVYQPHINGTLNDTSICSPKSVTYNAGPGQQYQWTDTALNILGTGSSFTTNTSGIYILTVDGGSNSSCYDVDTFAVMVMPSPPAFNLGSDTTISASQSLVLSMPYIPIAHYLWSTGDTTSSITIDNSFNWINKIIGFSYIGNQCYSSDTIYVFIGSVGIDNSDNSPVKIYPNPVQSFINIELQKPYSESRVEIFGINGKLISKTVFKGQFYKLNSLESLPKGIYILHLQNKELNVIQRFVKE